MTQPIEICNQKLKITAKFLSSNFYAILLDDTVLKIPGLSGQSRGQFSMEHKVGTPVILEEP